MFKEIDTPALLIEQSILHLNIVEMQGLANSYGLKFRPHVKTHKSIRLAQLQLDAGACGIAVAKLSEAEVFAKNGISDIQVDNQIVGHHKINRLLALSDMAQVSCAVDSIENVLELSAAFSSHYKILDVFIEIDSGLHRSGLSEYKSISLLCRKIISLNGLRLIGLLTHAGHAYSAKPEDVADIGFNEGKFLVEITKKLRQEGIEIKEISVGSTPTAHYASQVDGVTELRAGNYIFNDFIQVVLQTVKSDRCALSVLTSVISCPSSDRVIIDAGSKSFSSDRGAHGSMMIQGYGKILIKPGELVRLSEEHGVIDPRGGEYWIGERLRVIPNHACPTVNLFNKAYIVNGEEIVEEISIDARGCSD